MFTCKQNLLIEILFSFIKLFLLYFSIIHYGRLYGIIIFWFINNLKINFFNRFFDLKQISNTDKMFISTNIIKFPIILGVLFFKNFNTQKIKKLLIERGLKNIKKLRSRLVYKYFNYYWEEISLSSAVEKIKIIKNINNLYKDKDSVIKLANKEINKPFCKLNFIPYEFILLSYGKKSEKKGPMIIKFDHLLCDGLSLVSLITCMSDNFSPNIFPSIMHKKENIFLQKLLDYFPFLNMKICEQIFSELYNLLTFPYYFPICIFQIFIKTGNTSFKSTNENVPSYMSVFEFSKNFDLKIFQNLRYRKELNFTFNDLIMCGLSLTVNKLCENSYDLNKDINCYIPMGFMEIPENVKKLEINNYLKSINFKLKNIQNFENDRKNLMGNYKEYIKNPCYFNSITIFWKILFEFFPLEILQNLSLNYLSGIDILTTNVPGPTQKLYYAGCLIEDIHPILSTFYIKNNLVIFSYKNQFRFTVCKDENSRLNIKKFLKIIELTIDDLIKN